MRIGLALLTLVVGVALAVVTYFFLAAPLGLAVNEGFSNPRVSFAATLFIIGVVLVFLSPVVYELYPGREPE